MSAFTGIARAPGRTFLEGVLPAGSHRARLDVDGARPVELALHEGCWAFSGRGANALRFVRAGRTFRVPVPRPIATPPPGASPGTAAPPGP